MATRKKKLLYEDRRKAQVLARRKRRIYDEREEMIRKWIAQGYHTCEITSLCRMHPAFRRRNRSTFKLEKGFLSRERIKTKWIGKVRKKLREELFDGTAELRLAYERLQEAYRIARKNEFAPGMVNAQKQITQLLGLRPKQDAGMDAAQIAEQLAAMMNTVPSLKDIE